MLRRMTIAGGLCGEFPFDILRPNFTPSDFLVTIGRLASRLIISPADGVRAVFHRHRLQRSPARDYYNGGLLVLTVNDDGTAIGHIAGKVSFMTLREQRFDHPGLTLTAHDDAQATVTETDIHPAEVANGEVGFDACIAIALRVPSCDLSYAPPELDENGEGILWLVDHTSGSWARLHHHPDRDGPYRVLQSGSRRLWHEVETRYHWWRDAGCPSAGQWRFTITAGGQHVHLPPSPD